MLRGFLKDRSGGIAVMFIFAVPVLALMTAAVTEFASAQYMRDRLQKAADAGALAAAAFVTVDPGGNPEALRAARAEKVFFANLTGLPDLSAIDMDFKPNPPFYTIDARVTHSPLLVGMSENLKWDIGVSSTAQRRAEPLELTFVFDTTASMNITGSWTGARDRLVQATRQIADLFADGGDVTVSFVPFSDRVNLGPSFEHWLDDDPSSKWKGCFRPREEPEAGFPYALTDTPPSEALFEHSEKSTEPSWHSQPKRRVVCPMRMTPPTSNLQDIEDAILALSPGGTGRFDQGLAWGWRTLSPRWAGEWGVANYPKPAGEVRKMLLYIADGYSTVNRRLDLGGMGEHDGEETLWNRMSVTHREHLVEMCEKIRAQNIEVVMIAPKNTYERMLDAMTRCAVDGSKFFRVEDNEDLEDTLEHVVGSLIQGPVLVE